MFGVKPTPQSHTENTRLNVKPNNTTQIRKPSSVVVRIYSSPIWSLQWSKALQSFRCYHTSYSVTSVTVIDQRVWLVFVTVITRKWHHRGIQVLESRKWGENWCVWKLIPGTISTLNPGRRSSAKPVWPEETDRQTDGGEAERQLLEQREMLHVLQMEKCSCREREICRSVREQSLFKTWMIVLKQIHADTHFSHFYSLCDPLVCRCVSCLPCWETSIHWLGMFGSLAAG